MSDYSVGQELKADLLADGDEVDVTAVGKGKGTAGTMKRHGFGGLPAGHGAHRVHRAPGSIGACATPSRVFRGTGCPVAWATRRSRPSTSPSCRPTPSRDLVLVRGSVPGPKGGLVLIRDAVKASA